MSATPRRNLDGEVVGMVGVGQDITELRLSQAQVLHASKLASLGDMATAVAHELNQPLNVIRLAASNSRRSLAAGLVGAEDYLRSKLERIEEQTERASSVIERMRVYGSGPSENLSS